MRKRRARIALIGTALAALCALPSAASAHAYLVKTVPAARRRSILILLAVGIAGCGSATTTTSGGQPSSQTGAIGTPVYHAVPAALRRLPLTDQDGRPVTLASWPGRTVMLVPFLSLCQDVCPMTTGNLLQVTNSLRADHAGGEVQIVELSVDPERDTPARLKAYANLTGASWQLVTETPAVLHKLAKFFGFYFQKVPEDDPAARDWWTGKPLTYDVDHSDNYFVIDPSGVERVIQAAAPWLQRQAEPEALQVPRRARPAASPAPAAARLDARRRARGAGGVGGQATACRPIELIAGPRDPLLCGRPGCLAAGQQNSCLVRHLGPMRTVATTSVLASAWRKSRDGRDGAAPPPS